MCRWTTPVLSALACFWGCGQSQVVDISPKLSLPGGAGVTSSPQTCPSKTVNYITHQLAQQCLKTGWSMTHTDTVKEPISGITSSRLSTAAYLHSATSSQVTPTSTLTENPDSPISLSVDNITESKSPLDISIGAASTTKLAVGIDQPLSSISPSTSASTPLEEEADPEVDSALDNAHFLSFEEWKKKNLARVGQSGDNIGEKRPSSSGSEARNRPGSISNALDSLGDDTEIDLDFGRFRTPSDATISEADNDNKVEAERTGVDREATQSESEGWDTTQRSRIRNKDAGKTCKERFNYASFDCAATVLKSNPESKGSSSILVENKDSYMLNECAAGNKFFIVELCDDILVDTIVLANFEFFSSIFRTFRVSVSDRYPIKTDKWKELGTFEATNRRDMQVFLVENPLIWARYVRVELLTHYGNEFYCPISLFRAHGTTMIEEFRHQEEAARGEEDLDEDLIEELDQTASVIHEQSVTETLGTINEPNLDSRDDIKELPGSTQILEKRQEEGKDNSDIVDTSSISASEAENTLSPNKASQTPIQPPVFSNFTYFPTCHLDNAVTSASLSSDIPSSEPMMKATSLSTSSERTMTVSHSSAQSSSTRAKNESLQISTLSKAATMSNSTSSSVIPPATKAAQGHPSDTERVASSSTHPPPANPTTQESFFKTIHKRLQLLEANATLSLQYIEEQSRILRDAFNKVEKRQLAKTTAFLNNLNTTVLAELRGFRQQYDQIWQSTVIELEHQREQSQKEILAVSARLTILADEVIFQKRMTILQSILLLLCLGFVIFSRGPASAHLELPLIQSMMAKSPSMLRLPFESPFGSPLSSRPTSSGQNEKIFRTTSMHHQQLSHGHTDSSQHLALEFSPPTPTSSAEFSGSEDRTDLSASPEQSFPLAPPPRSFKRQTPTKAHSGPITTTTKRPTEEQGLHEESFDHTDQSRSDTSSDSPQQRRQLNRAGLSEEGDDTKMRLVSYEDSVKEDSNIMNRDASGYPETGHLPNDRGLPSPPLEPQHDSSTL